jgi:YD repeat-containing protein
MNLILFFSFVTGISHFAFAQPGHVNERNANLSNNSFLLTGWLITHWNGFSWENAWKTTYTYDGNKNLASTTEQDWVDTSWVNQLNYLYLYDGENRLTEVIVRKWIAIGKTK